MSSGVIKMSAALIDQRTYRIDFPNYENEIVFRQPTSLDLEKQIENSKQDFKMNVKSDSNFLTFSIPNTVKEIQFQFNSNCPFPIIVISSSPDLTIGNLMDTSFQITGNNIIFGAIGETHNDKMFFTLESGVVSPQMTFQELLFDKFNSFDLSYGLALCPFFVSD